MSVSRIYKSALITMFLLAFCFCIPVWAISTQEEIQIGKEGAKKIESKYGIKRERQYAYRIGEIGKKLAAASPRKDIKYSYKVINTKEFNAMALPGGFIYATKGLMDGLNDAELAFVLGHETGHVANRHSIRQAEQNMYTTIGIFAVTAVLGKGKINQGSANTAMVLSYVMSNQYSQNDEREADRDGVNFMARAGYDPKYAVTAMETLKKKSGGSLGALNTFLGSHPLPDERIKAVREEGKKVGFEPSPENPQVLTGKDYARGSSGYSGNMDSGYRLKRDDANSSHPTKRTTNDNSQGTGQTVDPADRFPRVDYRSLSDDEIRAGTSMKEWELELQRTILDIIPNLTVDDSLDKEAFKLTMERSQSFVSHKKIVWVDLKENESLQDFTRRFRQEALPAITERRADFKALGIAVKKNSAGLIHAVVILK
ncbi:MAG: M48 family metallopeptidase [Firmicutes bacterium]|nr:M48 family metallopeptidase [Bacillota bacterium]